MAERLRLCARAGDTIARLGGDEFTLIINDVKHVDDAARVAQKVLDSLVRPLRVDERELFVTASIGISCIRSTPTTWRPCSRTPISRCIARRSRAATIFSFMPPT